MAQSVRLGLNTFGDITAGSDGRLLSHAQVIRNVIDQAVLADAAGVDFFGVGEHHRADFSVSSPEVVLAVIAGRTTRIRLGSAATILSSDDPVRVFERFATLHAATNGRVEVIMGRGWFTESFPLFGYELSQYGKLFEEKLGQFTALVQRGTVAHRQLRDQRVFPPVENGTLKTWIAVGTTPDSVLRAARYDLPLMLAVIGGEPQRFKPLIDLYHAAFARLGKPAQAIGVHSAGYVADSDARAREEFWPDYKRMRDRIGAERGWPPIERSQFDLEVERGSLYVGSPDTVARRIAMTMKDLDAERFDLRYSVGALPHEKLLHSIELYGSKVIPTVRDILG